MRRRTNGIKYKYVENVPIPMYAKDPNFFDTPNDDVDGSDEPYPYRSKQLPPNHQTIWLVAIVLFVLIARP